MLEPMALDSGPKSFIIDTMGIVGMKDFAPSDQGLCLKVVNELKRLHPSIMLEPSHPDWWRFLRRKRPLWKDAERYFKQHRDKQMKVSLPVLKCLQEPVIE